MIAYNATDIGSGSLNNAFCRGDCGERSCPWSATAIHSVAVDRTHNLSVDSRILYHNLTQFNSYCAISWCQRLCFWLYVTLQQGSEISQLIRYLRTICVQRQSHYHKS